MIEFELTIRGGLVIVETEHVREDTIVNTDSILL